METTRTDEVLDAIRTMLIEVVGEDYLLGIDIEMDTSFAEDVEIESIEFVALAEKLVDAYGERVDFVGWLASMELDDIIALTVGQVVDFVVRSTPD